MEIDKSEEQIFNEIKEIMDEILPILLKHDMKISFGALIVLILQAYDGNLEKFLELIKFSWEILKNDKSSL
jgi:hypothetical protein